jgi:hypothetical protein
MGSAQDRDTSLHRTLVGDDHVWGLPEQLLAGVVDVLNRGNWQRGGGKGKKPKPLPRPGVGTVKPKKVDAGTSVPLSQAQALFARHNPAAFTVGEADTSESAEQQTLPVETLPQ